MPQFDTDRLHHAVDFTPYEGVSAVGWPVLTMSRGEVIYRDAQVVARAGRGAFLPCGIPEPATKSRSQASVRP